MCRVYETRLPENYLNIVAGKLRGSDVHFRFDHLVDPEHDVSHGDMLFHTVVRAVEPLELQAGKMHHSLAHGFTRDGAGVDAGSSQHITHFHQTYVFP